MRKAVVSIDRILKNKVSRKKTKIMKTYLSAEERREVFKLVGDVACWLFVAYLEKSGFDGFDYSDEKMGVYLGWKASKIKRYRLMLTKANLYRQDTISDYIKKKKVIYTYLGEAISSEPVTARQLTETRKNG